MGDYVVADHELVAPLDGPTLVAPADYAAVLEEVGPVATSDLLADLAYLVAPWTALNS